MVKKEDIASRESLLRLGQEKAKHAGDLNANANGEKQSWMVRAVP